METPHMCVQEDEEILLHFTMENVFLDILLAWYSEKNTGLEIQSIGISLFCY